MTASPSAGPVPIEPDGGVEAIGRAFAGARQAERAALVPYVVAGYPDLDGSRATALAAIDAGADLLEIGLPYSDPLADGATLQRASAAALRAGASLAGSLGLIRAIHAARPATPLVVMAYLNQVLGPDRPAALLERLAAAGAGGVILADLTPDEGAELEAAAADAGLALVYLVTPTTPAARRAWIAARTSGFLYAVSLVGVTGARAALAPGVAGFLDAVRRASPAPVAVGFGVSRPAQVRRLAAHADGIIVASALVDALGPQGTDVAAMAELVRALRAATVRPAPAGAIELAVSPANR